MTSRADFYQRRDRRSVEYGLHEEVFERPVGIVVARDAAVTCGGQIACLALINMAARFHRNLFLDIPHVKLHPSVLVDEPYLDAAAFGLARKVDPFIQFGFSSISPCWTLIETILFLMRRQMERSNRGRGVNTNRDRVVSARRRSREWLGCTWAPT